MSRTVVVEVTAGDIAAGKREDCEGCPIACALRRAAGTPRAFVDGAELAAGNWDGVHPYDSDRVRMPREAVDFVLDFDEGRDVRPFAFTVELP